MSTTITYNGSTITQVNNETKTLLTSGKWLTGNIVLTDVSGSGTGTLVTKSIAANGSYEASNDNADGYSSVSVNVPNGISITEVANTTGTTAVIVGTEVSGDSSATLTTKTITVNGTYNASSDNADGYSQVVVNVPTSGGGSTPSATQHTIHLEFADETTTDILMYYDDSFISSTITSTVPDKYGQKTIVLASLDGTSWYVRPTETWETLLDGNVNFFPESGEGEVYPYCWISSLEDVQIPVDSVWKVTFNNNEYRLIGKYLPQANTNVIGNPKYVGGQDDNSGVPFILFNSSYGAWSGGVEGENVNCTHYFKIERLVTELNSESE